MSEPGIQRAGNGTETYIPTPAAAAVIHRYWPDHRKPWPTARALRAFQWRMNAMQVELLNLYRPIMSADERRRADRALADLRARAA